MRLNLPANFSLCTPDIKKGGNMCRGKKIALVSVIVIGVFGLILFVSNELPAGSVDQVMPLQTIPEHESIAEYTGPGTCVACHEIEAQAMFGSVHYQWTGSTLNVPNISGNAGKGDLGFNTYCGAAVTSRRAVCWSCHVGNGNVPLPEMTPEQLNNIDCLMCHHELYKRRTAGPFETVTFTDYQGVQRSWQLPIEDESGNFQFIPDEENMPIGILQVAQTVHLPTRATCLRCHAYAAGTDCGKRGDISSITVEPPADDEIHMSFQGANLSCQGCHQFQNHKVMGRGLDIRPNDIEDRLTCTTSTCHGIQPHGLLDIDKHTTRVACQTCHIPTYAKGMNTEVARDWRFPFFSVGLLGGQGGFKPEETPGMNLIPTYAWFDGTSQVYALGQAAVQNTNGQYEMAAPNGNVRSARAMINPMKEHISNSAIHDATGQMIPHSTFKYFVTGDFTRSVEDGLLFAGLTGNWTLVDVHTYQTLNHGVEPKGNALNCGQCHEEFSGGNPIRMDLQADFGYQLKAEQEVTCIQCHELKASKGFEQNHNKHVQAEKYDCSWCHAFSRPERGLTISPDICEGDFQPDGDVDGYDLDVFAADFGRTNCMIGPPCQGDLVIDGVVDENDLEVFTVDFGRTDCF